MTIISANDPIAGLVQQISTTATIDINEASVGAGAMSLFQKLFLADTITVQGCKLISSDASSVYFSGTIPLLLSQANISGKFLILDSADLQRNLVFSGEWPTGLTPAVLLTNYTTVSKPSDLFGIAGALSFIGSVAFSDQSLLFSSITGTTQLGQVKRGLFFPVTASLSDDVSGILGQLFTLPSGFSFDALISDDDGFMLSLDYALDAVSKSLGPFDIGIDHLTISYHLAYMGMTVPDLGVSGHVDFGLGDTPFSADVDLADKLLYFEIDDINPQIPSISDFASKLGLGGFDSFLPGAVGDYGNFYLPVISATIDISSVGVEYLSVQLTSDKPVSLIGEIIQFLPLLTLEAAFPFDSNQRKLSAALSGQCTLGNTRFDLGLSIDENDFYIQGQMSPGQSVDLTGSTLFSGVDLPSINMTDFEFEGSYTNKSFTADIEFVDDWSINLAGAVFAISEIDMELTYEQGQISDLSLHGSLDLFSIPVDASASYDESSGWYFEGGTVPGDSINLGGLISKITGGFSTASSNTDNILSSLTQMQVSSLFVQYDKTAADFQLHTRIAHLISFSNKFSIEEVLVSLHLSGKDITGSCTVKLTLAGVDMYLTATKTNDAWTFSGGTEDGVVVDIGKLYADLTSYFGVPLPNVLAGITLSKIAVSFNETTKEFTLDCDGTVPLPMGEMDIHCTIDLKQSGSNYSWKVTGYILIDGVKFNYTLKDDPDVLSFIASSSTCTIDVYKAISALSSDLAQLVPESFTLTLDEAMVAIYKDAKTFRYLLGLEMDVNADLSNIPIVGSALPAAARLSLDNVKLLFASAAFLKAEIVALGSDLLPQEDMPAGFVVSGNVSAGGDSGVLQMGVGATTTGGTSKVAATGGGAPGGTATGGGNKNVAAATGGTAAGAGSAVKWWALQRTIGPVTFERIGIQYQDGVLYLLMDVKLVLSGLTLELDGVGAGSSLQAFDLKFTVSGVGISYESGPVTISGALLSTTSGLPKGSTATFRYDGEVIIQTDAFTMAAIGSYSDPDGKPSLFVFAELDKELGGPPYLFVTGLSAGFGYNSQVTLPDQDEVINFPLVQGLQGQTDPMAVLNILQGKGGGKTWVNAQVGDDWLAFGVQFTSFELIRTRALLIAEFGQEFELALIGISSMQLPQTGSDVYAYVEMGLEARFLPQEGFFGLTAIISANSFVLDPSCKLTGGFAFYSWFGGNEHSGDFVVTAGGYHPSFSPPDWYPAVSRLGFNWSVSDSVTISGDAYFALTPSCVMAGGGLQVLYHDGDLKAWFNAYADLIIYWKPFHFHADIGVSIGVSYRLDLLFTHVTLSVELGASLTLWGPATGGTVHIDWYIISFSVGFGADESTNQGNLAWADFKTLLPEASNICKISINGGLQNTMDERWIVRADELSFTTNSAIPGNNNVLPLTGTQAAGLNIRPMGVTATPSAITVSVTGPNGQLIDLSQTKWKTSLLTCGVPDSLWGDPSNTQVMAASVITGQGTGLTLTPPDAIIGNSPGPIDMGLLKFEDLPGGGLPLSPTEAAAAWVPVAAAGNLDTVVLKIMDTSVQGNRSALFDLLKGGYPIANDPLVRTQTDLNNYFIEQPLLTT